MNLTRWNPSNLTPCDPFRELEEMSTRLNRFFGQPLARQLAENGGLSLADRPASSQVPARRCSTRLEPGDSLSRSSIG